MEDILETLKWWQLLDAPPETEWIAGSLTGQGVVSVLVPPVFEAYARVLHPAYSADGSPVHWEDISRVLARPLGAGTSFAQLTGLQGPGYPEGPPHPGTGELLWEAPPEQGTLDPRSASALATTLEACTSNSADWFFGLWEGYSETAPCARQRPHCICRTAIS